MLHDSSIQYQNAIPKNSCHDFLRFCGIFTEIEFMLFVLELFDLPSYVTTVAYNTKFYSNEYNFQHFTIRNTKITTQGQA